MSVAVIIAVLGGLAACGGDGEDSGIEPLEPTSSASSETSAPADSVPERPDDERSDAGAIAFSEFVVRYVIAATGGASLDDFLGLATDSCDGCIQLARDIGERPDTRQRFDEPPVIEDASVVKTDGDRFVVDQTVSVSAGERFDTGDDSVVEELDASTFRFTVAVTWFEDQWFLSDYAAEKTS